MTSQKSLIETAAQQPRPRRWLRSRLLRQIAIALAVTGLVPLLVAGFLMLGVTRRALEESARNTHVSAAHAASLRVDQQLRAWLAIARGAASDQRLLEDPDGPGPSAVLSSLVGGLPGARGAALMTTAGGVVLRAQQRDEGDHVERVLHDDTRERLAVVGVDEKSYVRLRVPVANADGWLVLVLDAASLEEQLTPLPLISWGRMALVNPQTGPFVGALDPGWSEAPEGLATTNRNFAEASHSGTLFAGSTEVDGVLGAYSGLEEAPWYVLSQRPPREVYETTSAMLRNAVLAIAVATLLVLALSATAYSSLVRPLRELIRSQRELLGKRGEERGSGDEISDLKTAFRELEQRIRERDALEKVFLDRYQVLAVIGQGAMGMVFRGWDPRLERPVALKTLRLDKDDFGDERADQVQRLIAEAITVAQLNDPNIVAVYDVQSAGDTAFIAMELVEGTSLEHRLARSRRLGEAQVVQIGLAIARALAAAHRVGFVHQDIKPANVLLSERGQVKVVDFGIASLMSKPSDEDVVFGTPGYLPPEALEGHGFGPTGDLFALGAVLYQCLAGRSPFRGRGVSETIRRTLEGDYQPLGDLGLGISAELVALIDRLLTKDVARRPSSADAVVEALEALQRRQTSAPSVLVDAGEQSQPIDPPASCVLHPSRLRSRHA